MSNARARKRGFTLIEAMAAVVLLGIGIVGAMGANAQIIQNETRARRSERLQSLGRAKLAELVATGQAAISSNGDFTDQQEPTVTWSLEVGTSGITDLNTLKLTVQESGASNPIRLDTLQYVPPQTTTTSTGTVR